ncbi:MAG: ATP synthase F0 subunit C [Deltaproteobacteria bacterium]|nr:MAG: ATP synthase F0 subunit C [Deltaproteobacteria bacterium]PLX41980.1 MAG: ATP synthase F0 subunit C [Deltaproteobacteria bacterium]
MFKRVFYTMTMVAMAAPAFAADASVGTGMIALAAGLAIAIAAAFGALGQGRAAATALEGIARNPAASGKLTTPMIIGLALIESLVIYALVIAFIILGKI